MRNPYFEACRNPDHPFHDKPCSEECPDWELCNRGEVIEDEAPEDVEIKDVLQELVELIGRLMDHVFACTSFDTSIYSQYERIKAKIERLRG